MPPSFPFTGSSANCPHCGVVVRFEAANIAALDQPSAGGFRVKFSTQTLGAVATRTASIGLFVEATMCPNCERTVIVLRDAAANTSRFVWPEWIARKPIPAEVPDTIATDFRESALVLPYSPKASAALSRRCLQALLTAQGHPQHDLSKQIVSALPSLPRYLAENLDAVREIGNFAAHEIKSKQTGVIFDVEIEEAEWTLSVLEELFEFFYVRHGDASRRRADLNAKLVAAGRSPLKGTPKP